MAIATRGAVLVGRSELRTRTSLLLEEIALRHQIAVLERRRSYADGGARSTKVAAPDSLSKSYARGA